MRDPHPHLAELLAQHRHVFVTGAGDGDLATGDTDSTEIGGGLDAIGDDGVICAVERVLGVDTIDRDGR